MKKITILAFTLTFVLVSYAGSGVAESPKATNYKEILKEIEYPQVCRKRGIEGKVIVMLNVDKYGEVTSHEFKASPSSDMEEAVEAAIPSMTFKPAVDEDGENVAGKITLPINFKLSI